MSTTVVCRTCYTTNSTKLFKLESCTKKYPDKFLKDLLVELTKIELNSKYDHKLPQHLCNICFRKLENAYEFVDQARQANLKLLEYLKLESDVNHSLSKDCLQEAPMDVCTEQFLEVKLEENETSSDFANSLLKEDVQDEKIDQQESSVVDCSSDPLIPASKSTSELESKHKQIDSEDNSSDLDELPLQQRRNTLRQRKIKNKLFKCDECGESFRWLRNLSMHKRKHTSKTDWYPCSHCEKKFWRKDGLQSHLKVHGFEQSNPIKSTRTLSEHKQAKTVDVNLCKPHGCKLIQCMICLQKYDKIIDLRSHLYEHPNNFVFMDRSGETLQEIADSFNIDIKDVTEELLVARIRKELDAGNFDNYYSITNQSGYELSLSSSDTDSEFDIETREPKESNTQRSYNCELCNVKCRRKYQIFEHQRLKHDWQEANHVCRRCDARFVSQQMLVHHYRSQCKNARKRFICDKCPLRFRWKQNLKAHYVVHRKKTEILECMECKRSYEDKKSYTIHMLSAHADESKILPCHWCNRKFYRRDYMLKHLKRHGINERDLPLAKILIEATSKANGHKDIYCKICNLQFDRISELKEHMIMDLKLDLIQYQNIDSLCNYSITNESGFELHIDDSDTDNEADGSTKSPYTCEMCKVQCKRKFEMFQHQHSMHRFEQMPYSCGKCIFKCVSTDILEHHKRTQCLNTEKQLTCEKCGYKFMWPENLSRHMNVQHGDCISTEPAANSDIATKSNITTPIASTTLTPLQCPHCDRTYVLKSRLSNHIRDVHVEGDRKKKEGDRKFLCSLCGIESQSASTLATHMRRHTGERPFKCDMCEMAFPCNSDMQLHRRKHTGEKPYHCTVCGKDFARSDKLKRHMLTHSGLRPYKCNFCDKCYRQSKDLKLHLLQHTGETPFECNACGERFIQNSALEKHRTMRGHFDKI